MATLKKQMTPGIKSTGGKRRRTVSSSGMKVRLTHKLSQTASFRRAVEQSVATTRKNGNPVAKYDVQRRQAYLEYPDGKRTYVE